jgi:hypothetical protein
MVRSSGVVSLFCLCRFAVLFALFFLSANSFRTLRPRTRRFLAMVTTIPSYSVRRLILLMGPSPRRSTYRCHADGESPCRLLTSTVRMPFFLQPTSTPGEMTFGYDRFNTNLSTGAWSTTLPWLSATKITYTPSQPGSGTCFGVTNFVFHDGLGGTHPLGLADVQTAPGNPNCTVGWISVTSGSDTSVQAILGEGLARATTHSTTGNRARRGDAPGRWIASPLRTTGRLKQSPKRYSCSVL